MKLLCLNVALTLLVGLSDCNRHPGGAKRDSDPAAVAQLFLNGLYHMDYSAAKRVSTKTTREQLEIFETIMQMTPSAEKAKAKKIKVYADSPTVNGDQAIVAYSLSNDPARKTLKLIRANNKWRAVWSKTDLVEVTGIEEEKEEAR
jgi:hypothetical protein